MKYPKKGTMKVGIMTKALRSTTPSILKERLNTFPLDTIELDIPNTFPGKKDYISLSQRSLAEIKEEGFDISALKCCIKASTLDDEEWKYEVDNFRKALYVAKFLSSPVVTTRTGEATDSDREEKFNRLVSSLIYLFPYAEECGIKIALEPSYGDTINSIGMLEKLFSTVQSDSLALIFNPVALLSPEAEENTYEFYDNIIDNYGDKFAAMHISDTLNGESMALGKGIMAKTFPHIAKALRFNIPIILENTNADNLEDDILFIHHTFA